MKHINPKTKVPALLVVLLFVLASPAYADIGSAIVVTGFAQLIYLNVIIALVESISAILFLKNKFIRDKYLNEELSDETVESKLRLRSAYVPILIANVASAFIGMIMIGVFSQCDFSFIPLIYMGSVIVVFTVLTLLLTAVIEWPFVRDLVKDSQIRFKRPVVAALRLSLLINVISYLGLVPLYIGSGDISLITGAKYDNSASFMRNKTGHVYFVDSKTNEVYKMNPDGSGKEPIGARADYLYVNPSNIKGKWDLLSGNNGIIKKAFSANTTNACSGINSKPRPYTGSKIYSSYIIDLRKPKDTEYTLKKDLMVYGGLKIKNIKSGEEWRVGLETPFNLRVTSDMTLLPGEQIIWNYGRRILAYDIKTRRVSQLALGVSPIVTLD